MVFSSCCRQERPPVDREEVLHSPLHKASAFCKIFHRSVYSIGMFFLITLALPGVLVMSGHCLQYSVHKEALSLQRNLVL